MQGSGRTGERDAPLMALSQQRELDRLLDIHVFVVVGVERLLYHFEWLCAVAAGLATLAVREALYLSYSPNSSGRSIRSIAMICLTTGWRSKTEQRGCQKYKKQNTRLNNQNAFERSLCLQHGMVCHRHDRVERGEDEKSVHRA